MWTAHRNQRIIDQFAFLVHFKQAVAVQAAVVYNSFVGRLDLELPATHGTFHVGFHPVALTEEIIDPARQRSRFSPAGQTWFFANGEWVRHLTRGGTTGAN